MDTEWICFDAVTGYDKGELNHAAQILRQGVFHLKTAKTQ